MEEENKNKNIKINKESFVIINKGDITQFYEVVKKIGEGSFGMIFEADSPNGKVAFKFEKKRPNKRS